MVILFNAIIYLPHFICICESKIFTHSNLQITIYTYASHLYISTHKYIYMHTQIDTHTLTYICKHMHMYTICTYIYIHTNRYKHIHTSKCFFYRHFGKMVKYEIFTHGKIWKWGEVSLNNLCGNLETWSRNDFLLHEIPIVPFHT